MKENVVDVLMYLFETYMDSDDELSHDRQTLESRLLEAGFKDAEIEKAFDWLESLARFAEAPGEGLPAPKTFRLYHESEQERLDSECRGFLMFLEQTGVLTPASREMVIDRVMALDTDEIDVNQLKWVVLMVLFNLPGEETSYTWLENLVLDESPTYLH